MNSRPVDGSHVVIVNWKDRTHPESGGAEVYCEAVARELVALGCRVTLLAGRPAGRTAASVVDGYTVRRFGGTYTVYLFALLWLFAHRRSVDAVIDSQNGIPFFTPLVVRRATPVVLLVHHVHQNQFALYFSPLMARVGRWLESTGSRLVYRERAVAAVSPSSRREIRRQLGLKGSVYLAPNGSEPAERALGGGPSTVPTITSVGRLVPHKRWDLLLDLADELRLTVPDLRVNLVGAGPELNRLRTVVATRHLEDCVVVHGFITEAERDRLLGEAWLTVSTSVGEGWGLSIIEAAALGVPAVAFDVPGLRDSIRPGETGWLATEATLTATVCRALETLADPAATAEYALRCEAWAASLRWPATAERFHAIFAEEARRLTSPTRHYRTDVSTVVTLDANSAATVDLAALHPTDQSTFCPACLDVAPGPRRLLLHNRDECDAFAFLIELGAEVGGDRARFDVCRSAQLLTWQGDGVAHSYVSMAGGLRCPVHAGAVSALGRSSR